jgi:hypothetical protein
LLQNFDQHVVVERTMKLRLFGYRPCARSFSATAGACPFITGVTGSKSAGESRSTIESA